MKGKKIDAIFIILFVILTLFTFDLILFEGHRSVITNFWDIESLEKC